MANSAWELQRAYASVVHSAKGEESPEPPETYSLKADASFRRTLAVATDIAARRQMSAIILRMNDQREHPVRESILKLAFGQTRTPLTGMIDLASKLAVSTDRRTRPSLFVVTVEVKGESSRICMYVFPEESTYALRSSQGEPSEAYLEHLHSFVLESRLRKVARFEGKKIKTHFMGGEVLDLQIGSGPRTVADYWVSDFLDAEFAINAHKGTTLVASGLKAAFQAADSIGKQAIMEVAISLMADPRRAWSMRKIAGELIPDELSETFLGVAPNVETAENKFMLDKDLLRDRINYRVFQLESGVWVSSPFSEVGRSVVLEDRGKKRLLTAQGVVQNEKVRSNAKRPQRN